MCLRLIVILLLALFPAACAKKDPTVESLAGSEPQRLQFGPPQQVLPSFVEKMKLCWFSGPNAVLRGYRYETGERPADSGSDAPAPGYRDIKIYAGASNAESFDIQFHAYNENTLVVTRNVSLPSDLFEKLKRDIQIWPITGPECNGP